ncbi:hypothetical protein NDU88_001048 [Pleurodeles waltl]|uniref:Uncharacterized protein n=1 Tax=Pleurodeles waltl TaxID=8319 RepID=A0AAV7M1Z3_PLEWA|nr:hypothetical protein NDU88_001048 [Pleurodeles waltl]
MRSKSARQYLGPGTEDVPSRDCSYASLWVGNVRLQPRKRHAWYWLACFKSGQQEACEGRAQGLKRRSGTWQQINRRMKDKN